MCFFFILGTRPEIIKMAPLISRAIDENIEFSIIHSGQHYLYEMDQIFFEELDLPHPDYTLGVGSNSQGIQTAKIIEGVEKILLLNKPKFVFVEGDTNTTLGGALATVKIPDIKLVHIEAGCRSYNKKMPEEINRIIVDHVSDLLFAPNNNEKENLKREGIVDNIFVSGSTGVESCLRNIKIARKKSTIMRKLGLKKRRYMVVTLHRAENTNSKLRLKNIISALDILSKKIDLVFPMHPRTQRMIQTYNLKKLEEGVTIDPVGYLDFLLLLDNSLGVLTDSGGVQEDAFAMNIPCFTLREETEWVYTLTEGNNKLVGWRKKNIVNEILNFFNKSQSIVGTKPFYFTNNVLPSNTIFQIVNKFKS